MVDLRNWQRIVVPQQHEKGCVPTGYEWMIRYLGIQGVNLDTFQEDFNLELKNEGRNSFRPVAEKIMETYTYISIQIRNDFADGKEKIDFIEALIEKQIPCIMSLAVGERQFHIVPVVD